MCDAQRRRRPGQGCPLAQPSPTQAESGVGGERKEKVNASEERKRVALAALLGRMKAVDERAEGFFFTFFGSIKELMTGPPVVN